MNYIRQGKTHSGYVYYEVDTSSLGNYQVSGNHRIYQCPWCKVSSDSKKLYYHIHTGIGFCFRCETVIFDSKSKRNKAQLLNDLSKFSWLTFLNLETYQDISWTESALLSNEVKIYLSKRKYFYENHIISDYNLRYFTGVNKETVLVLPNDYPETLLVDSFQTSIVAGLMGNTPKYVTHSDTKVIYYLNRLKPSSTLVLVEGIFDAISVTDSIKSSVVACPMLGKSLSRSQQKQLYQYLKKHTIKEVVLALDGDVDKVRKIKTCRQLLTVNSSLKIYYLSLPNELDPEEAVSERIFNDCLSKSKRIVV